MQHGLDPTPDYWHGEGWADVAPGMLPRGRGSGAPLQASPHAYRGRGRRARPGSESPSPVTGRLQLRRQLGFTSNLAAAVAVGSSLFGTGSGQVLMGEG
jgi:hypothetical protein